MNKLKEGQEHRITRSISLTDSEYSHLLKIAQSLNVSISSVVGNLIPSPAFTVLLSFCAAEKVLSSTSFGEMTEELISLALIGSDEAHNWLSRLSSAVVKSIVTDAVATGGMESKDLTVASMLLQLRSPDFSIRLRAGFLLAASAGAAFCVNGEDREDVISTVGRDVAALIGQAQAGSTKAVNQLEKCLSNTRTPEKEPA